MDVEALRAQTPGCGHRMHLNNAGAALLAQPTIDAMLLHLGLEARIGGYEAAQAAQASIDDTSEALGELVGGRRSEIALFDNATHAWNAAFYSVPFRPGDRIVTGRAEYGSNVLAYLQIAQRHGVEVVVVPNDRHGQLDVAALTDAVDARTRLVGVSHVPTSGGLVNPAVEIGRVVKASSDALFLLDATQSVGQFPVDVNEIGCDLLTGTGRKFLRGPRGTGFLWVRESSLDYLDPHVAEIASATWNGGRGFSWAAGARRFESWENSYVNVIGLGAAVRQALGIGIEEIAKRTSTLADMLREGLDAIKGVTTHDLGVTRCAIVTAKVDGVQAEDVQAALSRAGINVSTTVAEHNPFDTEDRGVHPLVRLSPHYYNTETEIARTLEVTNEVARKQRKSR
jgi:selenocysteine lyase/cysteine desulfurase